MPRPFRIFLAVLCAVFAVVMAGAGFASAAGPTPAVLVNASCTVAAGQTTCTLKAGNNTAVCTLPTAVPAGEVKTCSGQVENGRATPPSTTATPTPGPTSCRRDEFFDRRSGRCVFFPNGRNLPPRTSTETNTIVNGDCTTVQTTTVEYQRALDHWNDRARTYRGVNVLNDVQIGELTTALRDRDRAFNRYEQSRAALARNTNSTTTCTTPPPPVTVTVEAPPVTYVAPQIVKAPSGSAETGDGSTE